MKTIQDGPASSRFNPITIQGNQPWGELAASEALSEKMRRAAGHAPTGDCVLWGIPFKVGEPVLISNQPVSCTVDPFNAPWLVFLHTSDLRPRELNSHGVWSPMRGEGLLNEHAADYVVVYADGSEERLPIRRRHQIGTFERIWGENSFQSVPHQKPAPARAAHEQRGGQWGLTQARVRFEDYGPWIDWLWAWENPHPHRAITALRFEPVCGTIVLSAVTAGDVNTQPLRWQRRRKALLRLPEGTSFQPELDDFGLLSQVQLDLGQVISTVERPAYPNESWEETYNNQTASRMGNEILLEYTSHPQACFHLGDGRVIPVAEVEAGQPEQTPLEPVKPATQRITLKIIERTSRKSVAVKLHVHGEAGEYLAPVDRHRIVNPAWFEDYSVDFANRWNHQCTYIPGETVMDLPLGRVYVEVSKGFEIRPVRKVLEIGPETGEITIEIEKVLPWREAGWVTADTHVHFLSPGSALLEGAAEGVNVVNLLASQWGELMTNVGDFDGRTTWGSREAGGDGEYLVRVGTENRQHVLGHISLLGYQGRIIAPMTTGGPDESALGDPVEKLLTEWARMCRQQGGLVVLPHFPLPRAEHAASIISGDVDALEMTSWGDLYSGISPYSLSDWYRYLNCGYLVPAVGGTDKMTADTAVGAVRTYARIHGDLPFTYQAWMQAVRRGETFVTYGPLMEFSVAGLPAGSRFQLPSGGGTLDIVWQVASVTVPVTRVDLVVNGEIRQSSPAGPDQANGSWSVKVDRSSWIALLVRGQYADQPEMIAAHSSPVMVGVEGTQLLAAADAVTILEQVEGALAYLDTIGTRAEDRAYKRMRLVLEGAHRSLHNRMHQAGYFHDHGIAAGHPEHH